jgi:hypothetical protein
VLNPDGSFEYYPNHNYSGVDSFTYIVNDGQDNSEPKQITIEISAIPQSNFASVPLDSQNQTPIPPVTTNIPDSSENINALTDQEGNPSNDLFQFLLHSNQEEHSHISKNIAVEHSVITLSNNYFTPQDFIKDLSKIENHLSLNILESDLIFGYFIQKLFDSNPDRDAVVQLQSGLAILPNAIVNVATIRERESFSGDNLVEKTDRATRISAIAGKTLSNVNHGAASPIDNRKITAQNHNPSNRYTILENGVLSVSLSGLLGVYYQKDSDLSVTVDGTPLHGIVRYSKKGAFNYTPNKGFSGFDYFTFKFMHNGILSDPIKVEILVKKVKNPLPHLEIRDHYHSNFSPDDQILEMRLDKIAENAIISSSDRLPAVEEFALTTVICDAIAQKTQSVVKSSPIKKSRRYAEEPALYSKTDVTIAALVIQEDLMPFFREELLSTSETEDESAPQKILKAVKEDEDHEYRT